jgi:ribosome-associated protein
VLRVTDDISIGEDEIELEFVRSPGPGGQKVNKTSTAVQLRFDVGRSPSLAQPLKRRLERLAGSRMTARGVLIIRASRYRTQKANRDDALRRLVGLIARAARRPKKRIPTAPTAAARRRRLEAKKRHSRIKRLRRRPQE